MRNDARPVGEDARDKSPIDQRDSVAHDRQSPVVNRGAEEHEQDGDADTRQVHGGADTGRVNRDGDTRGDNRSASHEDPVMPADESALNTKI